MKNFSQTSFLAWEEFEDPGRKRMNFDSDFTLESDSTGVTLKKERIIIWILQVHHEHCLRNIDRMLHTDKE